MRSYWWLAVAFFGILLSSGSLSAATLRFRMDFTHDTNHLSAMLVLKTEGDMVKGVMLNEFGVNFVEFTIKKQKARIVRLNSMLKKPFLKKILKNDFLLLWQSLNEKGEENQNGEEVFRSQKGGMYSACCIKKFDKEADLLSLHLEHQYLPLKIALFPF